jgi:subtilisin family serine protease
MGRPVVANLSLGGDFGPHDGTTPLELTLGSLVGADKPGRAFVVAAGNSGSLYRGDTPNQILGIHTQLRTTLNEPSRAPMLSPGRPGGPAIAGSVFIWVTYGASDRIAVGLSGPSGVSLAPTAPGTKATYTSPDGKFTVAVYNGVREDPSLPLSSEAHGAIIIWNGSWAAGSEFALEFSGDGFADAWVGSSLGMGEMQLFEHALLQGTVNVPATHESLLAVGCTVNRNRWTDADGHEHGPALLELGDLSNVDSSCLFSAAGPTAAGAMKPEISAPGALVAAAMSRDAVPASGRPSIFDASLGDCPDANACLVVDATHALLSGSSMSSPQVAGAVALLLERDPSLSQPEVTRLLQQGARRPAGVVAADYQLGPGALHVPGMMAALGVSNTNFDRVPDPAQSWMSLSDGFAHPDLGPSITGTVQLRASDASIADGFDPARLTVDVNDAGVIKSQLTRVAAGLWRFEMAGRPGTGQEVMTVNVRFDGAPIGVAGTQLSGTRNLPIGADRWVAIEGATAYGGCSLASRGRSDGERAVGAGALVGVAVLCRKRRRARHCMLASTPH